jgi:hypothetical protein
MNIEQSKYLNHLTIETATKLLEKFRYDPERADEKSAEAFFAFRKCWEMVYPGEYILRQYMSWGVHYSFIDCDGNGMVLPGDPASY